jgi:hypothetical protein
MIFELMTKLGKSHSKLVMNIYHKILDVDKRFLAKEPDQNDPSYVAKIILIGSAAQTLSPSLKIVNALDCPPFYLEKHLDYLRDKYCQYFSAGSQNLSRADTVLSPISSCSDHLLQKIFKLFVS